jgi:hypothetical protein
LVNGLDQTRFENYSKMVMSGELMIKVLTERYDGSGFYYLSPTTSSFHINRKPLDHSCRLSFFVALVPMLCCYLEHL